jgi:hypothetical protein
MITSILKVVLAGILGGFLLFIIPFLIFKALFFFLIVGLIFRLVGGGRRPGRWRRPDFQYYDQYEIVQEKETLRDQFNKYPKQV